MRHVYVVVFCLAVSGFTLGQDSRADLYGGYSYVNIDTNNLSPRQSANGWEAAISGNFNKWFAVEGDVSGYYKSFSITESGASASVKITDYSFGGGPRINFKPVFIHALFGGDHLTGTGSVSASGVSASGTESQDSLAGLVGGGVQFKVSGPWSIRASVDYVFTRHNIFGGPSVTQNNYRAGAGIVYSFGGRRAAEPAAQPSTPPPVRTPTPSPQPQPPAPPQQSTPHITGTGMKLDTLGVRVTLARSAGAEITDEAPDGVAALAGLHPGDVIDAVDGKPVKNPMELAAELANHQAGDKVRLGYMIHGEWQAETVVLLN